ncbi:unnamed protein product [Colias eurytheme]|nr:unnamed protein product [Colias eurytheme]
MYTATPQQNLNIVRKLAILLLKRRILNDLNVGKRNAAFRRSQALAARRHCARIRSQGGWPSGNALLHRWDACSTAISIYILLLTLLSLAQEMEVKAGIELSTTHLTDDPRVCVHGCLANLVFKFGLEDFVL